MWREIPPIFLSGHWEKRTKYKTAWSQACRAHGRQCSILARHAYPGAFLPGLKSHLWDLPVMTLISSSPEISFLFCIFGGRDCSFLTNHQENPSQMTMRYYLISMRMVIIKNQKVTSTNEHVELCTPMVGVWNGAAAPKQNWSFKKKDFFNHYLIQQCHAWVFIPKKNYNHDLKGTFVLLCTLQCFPQ